MRVLTWNLWWSFGPWESRQHAIRSVLASENPDIVLLQESIPAEGQARGLAAHLGFHHVETAIDGRIGQGLANAVLSKWPIVDSTQVVLPASTGAPAVRTVLACVVETPWGHWPVATTHLDHRFDASSQRLVQVDVVADVVHDVLSRVDGALPAIVGGDFNAVPDSDEIRRLTGRMPVRRHGLVFNDMWEMRGEGAGHTWSSANPYLYDANWPNRRIDYLFVTWPRVKPAGHPIRVWLAGTEPVEGVMPSDHFAVAADVRVPQSDSPTV